MPQVCKLCKHPKAKEIAKRYAEGWTFRQIAEKFGGSISSAKRHQEHIKEVVHKAQEQGEIAQVKTAYQRFCDLMDEAERKYKDAATPMVEVMWFKEWRGMMELGYKLGLEAANRNIDNDPQWIKLRTRILLVLEGYPEARRAIVKALTRDADG